MSKRSKRMNRTTRWSAIEWGKVNARAKSQGLSVSAYLRSLAMRDCARAEREAGEVES